MGLAMLIRLVVSSWSQAELLFSLQLASTRGILGLCLECD